MFSYKTVWMKRAPLTINVLLNQICIWSFIKFYFFCRCIFFRCALTGTKYFQQSLKSVSKVWQRHRLHMCLLQVAYSLQTAYTSHDYILMSILFPCNGRKTCTCRQQTLCQTPAVCVCMCECVCLSVYLSRSSFHFYL